MTKYLLVAFLLFVPNFAGATVYYIDFTNGLDTNDGLGTTSDRAFGSINQFANNARSAGDIAFVRRGMASTTAVTALALTSDGTLNNPITISADYDNLWSDFASSSVTWTPTFGSKFIASSASSTDFATTNKWIYLQGDCYELATTSPAFGIPTCEFAYEVASTSPAGLDLYLPYKGNQAGSGKNMRVMPSAPQIGTVTEANQIFALSSDDYWNINGFDIRSTNGSGIASVNSSSLVFRNMILQANGASDIGFAGSPSDASFYNFRIFNVVSAISTLNGRFENFLIDCNSVASARALLGSAPRVLLKDGEIVNCATNYFQNVGGGNYLLYKNTKAPMTWAAFTAQSGINEALFEDQNSLLGLNLNQDWRGASDTNATTTVSTTTVARSGGGPTTQYVLPPTGTGNTGLSTKLFPLSYLKLFEYPIYADTSSKTYTMYFRAASTSAFLNDPLTQTAVGSSTPELFIECEYYNDASDADRMLKRSNTAADADLTGNTDWQDISVTCQPTQAGVLYLRGWYAKPREAPTNQFYMDTTPVIQ